MENKEKSSPKPSHNLFENAAASSLLGKYSHQHRQLDGVQSYCKIGTHLELIFSTSDLINWVCKFKSETKNKQSGNDLPISILYMKHIVY